MKRSGQTNARDGEPIYLILGKLERPHGVRGEIRMTVLTDYPERMADLDTVYLGTDPYSDRVTAFRIDRFRFHQERMLLQLKGVSDRNDAEVLRGLYVMVKLEDAVPLEDDELYLYQLIGMQVYTEDETLIGTVKDVMETGANDVYVLSAPDGGRDVLIPAHDGTIVDIDTETNRVIVSLPEGLLDES